MGRVLGSIHSAEKSTILYCYIEMPLVEVAINTWTYEEIKGNVCK
jgi:hypothetical protein